MSDTLIQLHVLSGGHIPAERFTAETKLLEVGDSLDLYELVMQVEDTFGVTVPDAELATCTTVGDLVRVIDRLRAVRAALVEG